MSVDRVELIKQRLQVALHPERIQIVDESHMHIGHPGSSGGGHFALQIIASIFIQQSSLQRHKMIYKALGDAMGKEIHAISIDAKTPAEAANSAIR